MTDKEKVLSCYGKLNIPSIARVVGCDVQMVYYYLKSNNLRTIKSNRINPYK